MVAELAVALEPDLRCEASGLLLIGLLELETWTCTVVEFASNDCNLPAFCVVCVDEVMAGVFFTVLVVVVSNLATVDQALLEDCFGLIVVFALDCTVTEAFVCSIATFI